jgi:hypothetical protein
MPRTSMNKRTDPEGHADAVDMASLIDIDVDPERGELVGAAVAGS